MATPPRAVFFDLFGTLVAPFRRREHTVALRACAEVLGISFAECQQVWEETYALRVRGEFPTIADGLDHVVREVSGRRLGRQVLQAAEDTYLEFSIDSLRPVDGAAETLEWLCAQEIPLALVSNCAPDVPCVWARTVFASYFRHTVFSCEAMLVKPDPRIYRAAAERLGVEPADVLYVGDGSDEELTGAAACGMRPVLVVADLSNTYDDKRTDVDGWTGPRVHSLTELRSFVT